MGQAQAGAGEGSALAWGRAMGSRLSGWACGSARPSGCGRREGGGFAQKQGYPWPRTPSGSTEAEGGMEDCEGTSCVTTSEPRRGAGVGTHSVPW